MNTKQTKEFFDALNYIAKEKAISIDPIIKKLEGAIVLAVKKQYGKIEKINVVIDVENSNFDVSFSKMVVENVKNRLNEIELSEAKKINKNAKVGEYVEIEVDSKKIGRLAAQAAKQQIMQGLKEIERENVLEKIGDKIGHVLTAEVKMIDPAFKNVIFKIDDNEVVLFKNQQLLNDEFFVGQMVKVYAIEVDDSKSGSLIKISRTHPNFVKSLFELEVPEIEEKKVEIKKIARQPGIRTKIAVSSNDENIYPVGCFIGSKGSRIASVVKELNGEKIDVLQYSENEKEFIKAALAPAKVKEIEILEMEGVEKIAYVSVLPSEISLAIGVNGLNVKLAAMLTGFKIDINPYSADDDANGESFREVVEKKFKQKISQLLKIKERPNIKKTKEEIKEEDDIHSLEIEKMLREQKK